MNEDSNSLKGSQKRMNHILDNMDFKDNPDPDYNEDRDYNEDKTLQKLEAYDQKERKKKRLDITEAELEQQIHKLDEIMDKKKKYKDKDKKEKAKAGDSINHSIELESTTPLGNLSSVGNEDEKSVTKLYEQKPQDLMGDI